MLVEEWMTSKVITVTSDTSMMKASRIMKENNIRRLPVVNEDNVLVGIVTDRDIKDASPSKATTLDMHELYYLLSELKVKDIMTKNVKSAKPTDSVEAIALLMMKYSFGGVPIVDSANRVCGIITDSDIFQVLTSITGVKHGGIQFAFEVPNDQGVLKEILDELRACNAGVMSVLTSQESPDSNSRRVYLRLRKLSKEQEAAVVARIEEKFTLLYWEPGVTFE